MCSESGFTLVKTTHASGPIRLSQILVADEAEAEPRSPLWWCVRQVARRCKLTARTSRLPVSISNISVTAVVADLVPKTPPCYLVGGHCYMPF